MRSNYTRRRWLHTAVGAGLIPVLSGCVGSDDSEGDQRDGSDEDTEEDDGGTGDEEDGDVEDSRNEDAEEEEQEAETEIKDVELLMGESVTAGPDSEVPWVRVDVQNTTTVDHGYLALQMRFYDDEGDLMETRRGEIALLPAETTWRHYERFTDGWDFDDERIVVDDIEADVIDASPHVSLSPPDNVEVLNPEMAVEPESGVTVTGEVSTGDSEIDRLHILIPVYDEAGRLRGTLHESLTNLPASEQMRFEASYTFIRTPPDIDQQVSDHEVLLHVE